MLLYLILKDLERQKSKSDKFDPIFVSAYIAGKWPCCRISQRRFHVYKMEIYMILYR